MTAKTKVAVLISGRGSNMEALVRAAQDPACPFQIALVLSNKPEAGGLLTAAAAGIEALAVDQRDFGKDREAHERAIDAALRERGIQVVALAGYMRILTPFLVNAWEGRMLNIHPSLLPAYPGLDTHGRALSAGEVEAGCTVHLVTAGVDEGPVLGQARVPILPGDTEHMLSDRVLEQEHRLYPATLAAYVRERFG
ncbi:phosphoribosylglycinamide formyltransferase [Caulobacter sp. Root1455]|uniref:phosphoribosylglycinamide formyltransferase n=1 Tax=unclassified Caulobacter TaxID=2648921 RepID=UPI0006FC7FC1|nr:MULTISPECIES: phosphoribosylglycinamide formyltransferase [unclassified Caulobacter]KQY29732.1 phosphoribosylglycinamide formyltransferase [Caulobacter sp. Root487D2Y]KQZ05978.1 phosphoribosylglycinamide formyltransferase [Caulobacter sp. Root1455]